MNFDEKHSGEGKSGVQAAYNEAYGKLEESEGINTEQVKGLMEAEAAAAQYAHDSGLPMVDVGSATILHSDGQQYANMLRDWASHLESGEKPAHSMDEFKHYIRALNSKIPGVSDWAISKNLASEADFEE
jgi:hypothetical protein